MYLAADDAADDAAEDDAALLLAGAEDDATDDAALLLEAAGALVGGTGVAGGGTGVAVGAGAQDATTAPAVTTADNRKNSRRENARFIFLFLLWNPNKLC